MAETIPIQIRWPKVLAVRVRELAEKRHTTVSELTRQAVIDQYTLISSDHDAGKDEPNQFSPESDT